MVSWICKHNVIKHGIVVKVDEFEREKCVVVVLVELNMNEVLLKGCAGCWSVLECYWMVLG